MKTQTYNLLLTDTYGGEPNYSWVRRRTITVPENLSDLALIRRVKKELGIDCRTNTEHEWDGFTLRFPASHCLIAFCNLTEQ